MNEIRSGGVEPLWRFPLFSLGAILVSFSVLMSATGLLNYLVGASPRGGEEAALLAFFVGAALLITFRRGRDAPPSRISLRSGFLLTALGWLVIPLFAAAPFALGPQSLSLTDAVFEAVSGITTTGSTVIVGLDLYPEGLLVWRSLLQWIGGVGIIVTAVVLLPFLRVGGMQVFQLEGSDRPTERLILRSGMLVMWIVGVYVGLTVVCAIAYAAAGMTGFDAINHAMTTLATGGFSTHDASLAAYDTPVVRWVAVVFMLAGGLPFLVYVKGLQGRVVGALGDVQARGFLAGVVVLIAIAALARWAAPGETPEDMLSHTALNLVSIVTTTGYASQDYELWGPGFVALFFAATFFGGCAGSTSGGIKTYRFQLLFLIVRDQMRGLYDPHVVQPRRYGGRLIDAELVQSVLAFVAAYVGAVSVGAVALAWTGLDFVTALSGAAQAMGNVGPGLGGVIGPAGHFASLPDAAKWVLIALMLLGRLELFTLLVLFDPRFWRSY